MNSTLMASKAQRIQEFGINPTQHSTAIIISNTNKPLGYRRRFQSEKKRRRIEHHCGHDGNQPPDVLRSTRNHASRQQSSTGNASTAPPLKSAAPPDSSDGSIHTANPPSHDAAPHAVALPPSRFTLPPRSPLATLNKLRSAPCYRLRIAAFDLVRISS
ncbi:uncharacterized protein LOC131631847 [Vicia villosa]|uniref:uncharacterized protein LOC131631847 n=1 Tax=Vicia villosa TaxID=3911 RepID=UPI00273BE9E4|nr:uncharacterized protein LOC131631847 [Vicia villosa]